MTVRPSPIHETLGMLRPVAAHEPGVGFEVSDLQRRALHHPDVALVARLVGEGTYQPDFLTPKPRGVSAAMFREQLAAVEATPSATVREQLGYWIEARNLPTDHPMWRVLASEDIAARCAHGIRKFFDVSRPEWAGIHTTLVAEFRRVADELERFGPDGVIETLHPALGWDGRTLSIAKPFDERITYLGEEIVLVPCVTAGARLSVQVCDPRDASIVFPVHTAAVDATVPLIALVGRSRAALLADVQIPRSTSRLAMRHALSKATVSHHLTVLADAGLVAPRREGREVRYVTTHLGRSLLNKSVAQDSSRGSSSA